VGDPENLIARLVEGFNTAVEHEADPERKRRLQEVASMLGERHAMWRPSL